MKHLINKLSALLVMLMCMSATAQAEIVHHTVCDPTATSRGFTRECWEDTETSMFYLNEACTQELTGAELAKAVVYAKLSESPIANMSEFNQSESENDWGVVLNWAAVTTFLDTRTNIYSNVRYAEFAVKNESGLNARLVWNRDYGDIRNGMFRVRIKVNGSEIYYFNNVYDPIVEGVFVQALPFLKQGDVVRFEVEQAERAQWESPNPTFKACLEYVPHTHTYSNGRCICTCGYVKTHDHNYENNVCKLCGVKHHEVCNATLSSCGFTREVWELGGKYFADDKLNEELRDVALAKAVVYAKIPISPIESMSDFSESEHENDWSVDFNWAAVTTFSNAYYDWSSTPRSASFKASNENVSNARLVWNRNQMNNRNGHFTVTIYVNDIVKFTKIQKGYDYEGVFVQSLPELKKDDVVKFEVAQTKGATMTTSSPTFKASLEYTFVCNHQYPAGSAICNKCGEIAAHDHSYANHECTLCGAIESGFMAGYVGANSDQKNIMWVLDENTNVLTYTGTGAMEAFNSEHNAWKSEHRTTVTKLVIGEGITTIGDGSYSNAYFCEMKGLTEVSLPSTLRTIGNYSFDNCSNLASITLPEGLETIKGRGMRSCTKLTSITLPSTLKSIEEYAFDNCYNIKDVYIVGNEQIAASNYAFRGNTTSNITLHVCRDLYDWATTTSPWKEFNIPRPYNIAYTDATGEYHEAMFDIEATSNTFTLTDGWKSLTIYEDIPMQTLTYTRNFSTANQWQALCVPFEMEYSDWSDKFDVAAINNFHEYTNTNGETEKIELEVRYVKNGKLRANTPYLIRAKEAGEQTITLNNVSLKATESKSIDCRSTEREYTFTGTYDTIDGLKTKEYIFVSGGSLCKASNDTDVLKPMRWYLTISDRESMTINPSPALARPISIRVVGDGEATGISPLPTSPKGEEMIYNLQGVRLNKLQKGINIVGGKKIVSLRSK